MNVVRVVLDASGRAFRESIPARPVVVKPNRDELEEWVGEQIPTLDLVIAAARNLLGAGPEHVVLSLGPSGLLLVTPGVAEVDPDVVERLCGEVRVTEITP